LETLTKNPFNLNETSLILKGNETHHDDLNDTLTLLKNTELKHLAIDIVMNNEQIQLVCEVIQTMPKLKVLTVSNDLANNAQIQQICEQRSIELKTL
jgi:hypothetical protein